MLERNTAEMGLQSLRCDLGLGLACAERRGEGQANFLFYVVYIIADTVLQG